MLTSSAVALERGPAGYIVETDTSVDSEELHYGQDSPTVSHQERRHIVGAGLLDRRISAT